MRHAGVLAATMALLALGSGGAFTNVSDESRNTRRQRREPPPKPEPKVRTEVERWNAAVDQRKAEKRAAKLKRQAGAAR